jgi:NAD(P)-dependent dehydrogenase (short-subunit alcohol dehydrogenase family)
MFKRPGATGFGYNSTAAEVVADLDLQGRNILLTGCNSGIGEESLRVLTARGARVLATARTVEKAAAACEAAGGETIPLACELSDPASVRACVASVRALGLPLHAIVANAGIMALPKRETQLGFELQFFTNHVGHFILVTGLLDALAPDGRVVMLSSEGHRWTYPEGLRLDDLGAERGYAAWSAYGQSKLSNLLFARELSRRLAPGQSANSVHPGVIRTNLGRHMSGSVQGLAAVVGPLFQKTVPQGAATQVLVAVHPAAADITGQYWADCNVATASKHGQDDALAAALWARTEEIVAAL